MALIQTGNDESLKEKFILKKRDTSSENRKKKTVSLMMNTNILCELSLKSWEKFMICSLTRNLTNQKNTNEERWITKHHKKLNFNPETSSKI